MSYKISSQANVSVSMLEEKPHWSMTDVIWGNVSDYSTVNTVYCVLFIVKSLAATHLYLHSQKSFMVSYQLVRAFTVFTCKNLPQNFFDCKVICKKRETSSPWIISNIQHVHAVFTVDIFPYQSATHNLTECQCRYLTGPLSFILSCLYTLYWVMK